MIEKVNPCHPDKLADRIGGAMVDLAYKKKSDPRIAGEILLGHGKCTIITESNVSFSEEEVKEIVERIVPEKVEVELIQVAQDEHLANNQKEGIRAGDNGIFKGVPLREEDKELSLIAKRIFAEYPYDGKYILSGNKLIVCQSNCNSDKLLKKLESWYPQYEITVNPLGDWTGSISVDSGCCNRKLGSDMGESVTGGGLHFKDISKADVSANIYAFIMAQRTGKAIEMFCAIGDKKINGIPYDEIVKVSREYIDSIGGFEKLAEWGLF